MTPDKTISDIINKIRTAFERMKVSDKLFNNNLDKWNIACVAMDTLEDTELAIKYYKDHGSNQADGYNYLMLYGVLQSVYLQQDATFNLCGVFNLSKNKYNLSDWNEIRNLRNLTIAHPVSKYGQRCFISRCSITQGYFYYIVWDKTTKKDRVVHVNLETMLKKYEKESSIILRDILSSASLR